MDQIGSASLAPQRKQGASRVGSAADVTYFFEISQWWLVYAFSVVAAAGDSGLRLLGGLLSPVLAGPVLLTALFVGSGRFTEALSAEKYPEYAHFQRTTSMIVPLPPRRHADLLKPEPHA